MRHSGGFKCVDTCERPGTFKYRNKCALCANLCDKCSGPREEDCSKCKFVRTIESDGSIKCYPVCPNGYENKNSVCTKIKKEEL